MTRIAPRTHHSNGKGGQLPTQANQMAEEMAEKAKGALSSIGADAIKLSRNNPVPAVLIALGVGFLVARITHRS